MKETKLNPVERFHSSGYHEHNKARWEHLLSLGIDFKGKSVLELGAGIGDHTKWLLGQGARLITSIESRIENVEILHEKFSQNSQVNVIKRDIDEIMPGITEFQDFNIVYAYGILYHVADPAKAIKFMSDCCRNTTLIDTAVDYYDEYGPNEGYEDSTHWTNNAAGACCRPGRHWLFDELKKHFEHVYMPITQPNHEQFPVDWTLKERPFKLVRSVYVASRQEIDSPVLKEEVPMKQEVFNDLWT